MFFTDAGVLQNQVVTFTVDGKSQDMVTDDKGIVMYKFAEIRPKQLRIKVRYAEQNFNNQIDIGDDVSKEYPTIYASKQENIKGLFVKKTG